VNEPAPTEIGLGLGSNLGDRIAHLAAAKARIASLPGVRLLAASSLYETEPVGVKPEYQHLKFINAAVVIATAVPLDELHPALLAIEAAIGRARTSDKFAPRPLDIDILFAGSLVLDTPTLKLPHPQCLKRRFVLEPLAELVPDLVLAPTGLTIRQLLDALPHPEPVCRLDTPW
jgi:2-amino-4-hydroxy-6-hydroxymethyldihydropteridine diphosphokinase